jgi:hypothetical protein
MSPSVGHAAAESQGFKWESLMSAIDHPEVYDDLLDLLVESADVHRVLAFRLSSAKQARLDQLLDKNREGTLTDEESSEWEHSVNVMPQRGSLTNIG